MEDLSESYQNIFESFQPKILRYVAQLVGPDEAEDLTQEIFLKVNLALPGFRGESSMSTWLYRIATHCAYDRMRKPSFRKQFPIGAMDDDDIPASSQPLCDSVATVSNLEQDVVTREMGQCIQDYIARLPESQRMVLVLSDLQGLSNNEIGQILGISLASVKIRLHRARERLRQELLEHCEYYWLSELGWPAMEGVSFCW
jgi:RNA polymerase sigma-70 factor (ECF subfamily)